MTVCLKKTKTLVKRNVSEVQVKLKFSIARVEVANKSQSLGLVR